MGADLRGAAIVCQTWRRRLRRMGCGACPIGQGPLTPAHESEVNAASNKVAQGRTVSMLDRCPSGRAHGEVDATDNPQTVQGLLAFQGREFQFADVACGGSWPA
jgi:hypothetical protein